MARKPVLPPVYFLGGLLAAVAIVLLFPDVGRLGGAWRWIGGLLVVAGIALNVLADGAFKSHGTTVKPFEESSALITGGVFRITRNPMYVGVVLMLLGLALLMGSWLALVPGFLFGVLMDRRFVRAEERMLAQRFGAAWEEYARQTRRWL